MENNIQASQGELTMKIQITRKATGKVEEYTLTGTMLERAPVVHEATGALQAQQAAASSD